ncbi:MAG: DUF1549 and DUF1553 domain-containing protein [Planctomycetes bacterium]|nr:DUF1549 and DUF1553 domain-containing protein [Planctomycetota bacterium]
MFACRIAPFVLTLSAVVAPTRADAEDSRLRDTIDREIKAGWAKEKIAHPERSADSVFLRRVYLDLVGMIPTYDETTAFLKDTDTKKREKLIDRLLADPRYARQQSHVWDLAMLGRNRKLVEGTVGHRNRERFRQWLAKQFEANEPYDRIAAKILQAEEDGSQLYFAVNNNTDEMVTSVSRFFLATQIQCAKCHDHPFEPWTQKDYHGMASFFVRTMVVEVPGKPEVTNQIGKQYLVGEKTIGEALFSTEEKDQKTGKKQSIPIKPKFLSGAELKEPVPAKDFVEPKLKPNELPPKPAFSRREKFIGWMTAMDNPFFAKAATNRVWAQFMGQGFVHPVDDFNASNKPSLPDLLKAIEIELVDHKFDLKWLIREIVNSETYQAEDIGPVTDAFPKFYERSRIRPLSVEELTASLQIATGLGTDSALKTEPNPQMLQYLGEPTDGQGRFQGSLSEHLFLHNGDQFRAMCRPNKGNLPEKLLNGPEDWNAKVERMFLSVLSRPATSEEKERFVKYLSADTKDAKLASQRMEDAMWVLVSCSEFRFNR